MMFDHLLLFVTLLLYPVLSTYIIDDFETNGVSNWNGLVLSDDIKHSGSHSGCWMNTSAQSTIVLNLTRTKNDWTAYSLFSMWFYSNEEDVTNKYAIFVHSEDPTNSSKSGDYYRTFNISGKGWRELKFMFPKDFSNPASAQGWNKLTKVTIYSRPSGFVPSGGMVCVDDVSLRYSPPYVEDKVKLSVALVPGFESRFLVPVKGQEFHNKEASLVATINQGGEYLKSAVWKDTSKRITESRKVQPAEGNYTFLVVKLTGTDSLSDVRNKTLQIVFCLRIEDSLEEDRNCWNFSGRLNPDPAPVLKAHPYMVFNDSEIAAIKQERTEKMWIDLQVKSYGTGAKSHADYNFTFVEGLSKAPEYYYCRDGSPLDFNESSPLSHFCPSDKTYYTGEPYNGGWVAKKHSRCASYAHYLAFGYLFEKNETYLNKTKEFFIEYGKNYQTNPNHGTNVIFVDNGGRCLPDLLTESLFCLNVVEAYDAVYEGLSREEKSFIEYNLLRPLYISIERYVARNNHQTWHNAAMTALGIVLNDRDMVEHAIESDNNGFKKQIDYGIGDDGIWYEQSMEYHYFALSPLQSTAIYASHMGYDLFHYTVPMQSVPGKRKGMKDLYIAPIHLMMPNYNVPQLDDGVQVSLPDKANMYEVAYQMYPEEESVLGWSLCTFLANKTRGSDFALKYRKDLPDWCTDSGPEEGIESPLMSEYMEVSGASVLRKGGDYLFMENGPHGGGNGGHGHYDKLGLIFYSHGTELMKDYGTLPYNLPMHLEYFRRTLSHSSPMLDGVCQAESMGAGPAVVDGSMRDVQISKLTTSALNEGNRLRRTLFLIEDDVENNEYPLVLDISEAVIENQSQVSEHFFDLISHAESPLYSLDHWNGSEVRVNKVTESMGTDVAWKYLESLQKTESKEPMIGTWSFGHTVRHQFDVVNEWTNMELSTEHVKMGKYSMKWKDHTKKTGVQTKKFMTDWTNVDRITLSLYNVVNNTEILYFVIFSENLTTSGEDYYYLTIPLNWTGWKIFNWTKNDFRSSKWVMGWDCITKVRFSASYASTQCESSELYFDSMQFWREDGSEIDSLKGLQQYLPKVDHDRKTFYDLNAHSNPTSILHAVSIIRQNAVNPVVQLLKPCTETKFVSSFSHQSGDKSYLIKTTSETITINPGDLESEAPCASVKRTREEKIVTTMLACQDVTFVYSELDLTVVLFSADGSVISIQSDNSEAEFDSSTKTISFKNVKIPGNNKVIGMNVSVCSSNAHEVECNVNGKSAKVVSEKSSDNKGCVKKSFSMKFKGVPYEVVDLSIVLKEFVFFLQQMHLFLLSCLVCINVQFF